MEVKSMTELKHWLYQQKNNWREFENNYSTTIISFSINSKCRKRKQFFQKKVHKTDATT